MNDLRYLLEERKKELDKEIRRLEKLQKCNIDGKLRISQEPNRTQYYLVGPGTPVGGKYIRKRDMSIAAELAQSEYHIECLKRMKRERNSLLRAIKHEEKSRYEDYYDNLIPGRKCLITPIKMSDEEFVKKWESLEYQGKEFKNGDPLHYTNKNERVRSKSEVLIANQLLKRGIPYRYEFPFVSDGRLVYTDFTVLNVRERKEIRLEHLGMTDRADYSETTIFKLTRYQENGLIVGDNLVLTFETSKCPLNLKTIDKIIDTFFI